MSSGTLAAASCFIFCSKSFSARLELTGSPKSGGILPAVAARLSGAAFFFALLWMVHPVHSAAVDYISGRADSLAFFFACAGWLLYLQAREMPRNLAPWRLLRPRVSIWIARALLAGERLHVDARFSALHFMFRREAESQRQSWLSSRPAWRSRRLRRLASASRKPSGDRGSVELQSQPLAPF